MPTTLQHHPAGQGEIYSYVRAIELLLDDERGIGNKRLGFLAAKVLVVIRALRAEQMRRARVLDEIITRSAQNVIICL